MSNIVQLISDHAYELCLGWFPEHDFRLSDLSAVPTIICSVALYGEWCHLLHLVFSDTSIIMTTIATCDEFLYSDHEIFQQLYRRLFHLIESSVKVQAGLASPWRDPVVSSYHFDNVL